MRSADHATIFSAKWGLLFLKSFPIRSLRCYFTLLRADVLARLQVVKESVPKAILLVESSKEGKDHVIGRVRDRLNPGMHLVEQNFVPKLVLSVNQLHLEFYL